jgi:fructose-1-phosphate kinase PfkB-like protein
MKPIVTLTLNPAIDGAAEAEQVRPIGKVRTWGATTWWRHQRRAGGAGAGWYRLRALSFRRRDRTRAR